MLCQVQTLNNPDDEINNRMLNVASIEQSDLEQVSYWHKVICRFLLFLAGFILGGICFYQCLSIRQKCRLLWHRGLAIRFERPELLNGDNLSTPAASLYNFLRSPPTSEREIAAQEYSEDITSFETTSERSPSPTRRETQAEKKKKSDVSIPSTSREPKKLKHTQSDSGPRSNYDLRNKSVRSTGSDPISPAKASTSRTRGGSESSSPSGTYHTASENVSVHASPTNRPEPSKSTRYNPSSSKHKSRRSYQGRRF